MHVQRHPREHASAQIWNLYPSTLSRNRGFLQFMHSLQQLVRVMSLSKPSTHLPSTLNLNPCTQNLETGAFGRGRYPLSDGMAADISGEGKKLTVKNIGSTRLRYVSTSPFPLQQLRDASKFPAMSWDSFPHFCSATSRCPSHSIPVLLIFNFTSSLVNARFLTVIFASLHASDPRSRCTLWPGRPGGHFTKDAGLISRRGICGEGEILDPFGRNILEFFPPIFPSPPPSRSIFHAKHARTYAHTHTRTHAHTHTHKHTLSPSFSHSLFFFFLLLSLSFLSNSHFISQDEDDAREAISSFEGDPSTFGEVIFHHSLTQSRLVFTSQHGNPSTTFRNAFSNPPAQPTQFYVHVK